MFLTTCPTCAAKFKVQPEQLSIRHGRVMCGRCRSVFNAFVSLSRESAEQKPELDRTMPLASITSAPSVANAPVAVIENVEVVGKAGKVTAERVPDRPNGNLTAPTVKPALDIRVPPVSKPADTVYPRADLRDGVVPVLADNALLAERRRVTTKPRTTSWTLGVLLLATTLAALLTYGYRNELAQQYPQLQPALTSACGVLGCTIAWGRDANAIQIETSDMISPPDKPDRIILTAHLLNRARVKQDFPTLELRLMDNANQIVLRRHLAPADYLGHEVRPDEALAPEGELFLNLTFDTLKMAPASGYGLRPFYP